MDIREGKSSRGNQSTRRPFLGVHFECCNVYVHIYRNATETAYEGHCPRCGRIVRIPIGEGGSSSRIFRAS
jgi:hypothetical protein